MVYIVVLQMPCADKSAKFNGAVSCGATHVIKWFDKIRGVVFSVLCSSRFTRLGPRSVAPLPKRPYTTYSFCARVATYIVWTIGIDTQKKTIWSRYLQSRRCFLCACVFCLLRLAWTRQNRNRVVKTPLFNTDANIQRAAIAASMVGGGFVGHYCAAAATKYIYTNARTHRSDDLIRPFSHSARHGSSQKRGDSRCAHWALHVNANYIKPPRSQCVSAPHMYV